MKIFMHLISVLLMLIMFGCNNPFVQEKPEVSQLSGLWQSQYVPRSQQEDYGFPAKMSFRLNEDGTAIYQPFSIVEMDNEVWTVNSTGSWYLMDANPLGLKGTRLKWEVRINVNEPNAGLGLYVMEKKGQLVLRYVWDPDLEAIIFVRVPE